MDGGTGGGREKVVFGMKAGGWIGKNDAGEGVAAAYVCRQCKMTVHGDACAAVVVVAVRAVENTSVILAGEEGRVKDSVVVACSRGGGRGLLVCVVDGGKTKVRIGTVAKRAGGSDLWEEERKGGAVREVGSGGEGWVGGGR